MTDARTVGGERVNILVAVGTRPEAIKMLPVILALRASEWFSPVVITTGQHRDLVEPILALGGIGADVDFEVGKAGLTLNELISAVVTRLDAHCRTHYGASGNLVATAQDIRGDGFPAATLVHGDTSSALAIAIASFNLRIPVAHVEAGLRTNSTLSPFPEELNRQLISRIASLHFAPTSINEESLVREGVSYEQVFVTGNTGIDALRYAAALDVDIPDPAVADVAGTGEPLVIVTAHRRENWHGGLGRIAAGIARLAADHRDTWFVVPLHPNPIVRSELGDALREQPNVLLTEPFPYAAFAALMARATLMITDSGGIQEEAPALDLPVLVARDTTERQEGVDAGTLRLVGTDPAAIYEQGHRLLSDPAERALMAAAANPYGDGRASERIVSALEWIAGIGTTAPARLGPGFSRRAVLAAAGYRGSLFTGTPPAEPRGDEPDRGEENDRWVGR